MTEILRVGDMGIEDFFDVVIRDLGGLEIELDDNPLEMGPSVINEKIAQCRRNINTCDRYIRTVSAAKAKVNRRLRVVEAEYRLKHDDLYANDPRIRAGRSEKEREALISSRLVNLIEEIDQLKSAQSELDQLDTIVKATRSSLRDVNGRIKDQITMCQEDIKLGSRWGMPSVLDGLDIESSDNSGESDDVLDRDILRSNSVKKYNFIEVESIHLYDEEGNLSAEEDIEEDALEDSDPEAPATDTSEEMISEDLPLKAEIDIDALLKGL